METAVLQAEELGFWGVTMPDHYMIESAAIEEGHSTLDSWIAITYLAAKT